MSLLEKIGYLMQSRYIPEESSHHASDPAEFFEKCVKELSSPTVVISLPEFESFLAQSHDRMVKVDAALRALYFRAIRYCIKSKKHAELIVKEVGATITRILKQ